MDALNVKVETNYEKLYKVVKLVTNRKMDPDKASELFYTAYHLNEISRLEFYNLYNELEKHLHNFLTNPELANILKRMDQRTLGEFALKIYDNTLRERILAEAWINSCKSRNLVKTMKLKDNGMDNRGTILFKIEHLSHKSDFMAITEGSKLAIPDGTHPLEMKYCPTDTRLHFKEKDLISYRNTKSYALIIMGKKSMIGSNGNPTEEFQMNISDLKLCSWGILTPEKISEMLNTLPSCIYDGYMGRKPCIRVCKSEEKNHPSYSKYMQVETWE